MTILSSDQVWRDYVTDGVPGSGAHDPDKSEIREWANAYATPYFKSKTFVETIGIGASTTAMQTNGFQNPGDGGGGLYSRVDSEPSHAGKVRSTDRYISNGTEDNTNGGWWELVAPYPNVKQFGATGDGSTDDATALQNAIDYAEGHAPCTMLIPSGSYKTSTTLTIDTNAVGLVGSGPAQTSIIGTFAAGDILHLDGPGSADAHLKRVYLRGFRLDSSVTKTSGSALHLEECVNCDINDVWAAGQYGEGTAPGNLWDGFEFEGVHACRVKGFSIWYQNEGLVCYGTSGLVTGCHVSFDHGQIVGGGVGVHIGGNVGGFYMDATDINDNDDTSVLIDQGKFATGNREVFFGPGVFIDGESVGGVRQQPGIVINDAGFQNLFLDGVWFSVLTYGIDIQSCSSSLTRIHINGGRIAQCDNDGIRIGSEPRLLLVSGCEFADCTGWGINATATLTGNGQGEGVFIYPNNRFRNNAGGDVDYADIPVLPGTSFTIALDDDEAYSFTPRDQTTIGSNGAILITEAATNFRADFFYRASTAANIQAWDATNSVSGFTLTTGALTGTTGSDGNQTIASHTDKKIYVENRSGSAKTFCITLHAAYPQMKGN
ncbi:glycosyl hydrolase family 28-related protein [uncultured Roseibium sp.]|uniref:glycosyl hydrolase family 28-related protein n=1 Tax=uncultured Roseibium sp. TaxID=1936171 RepID=UPI00262D75A9|nr:glycosyl hydrolase family 28-related protein [uncultured Roseibium sp.]